MSIIKINSSQEPRFISECSKHISDVLNTKVTFSEVADELLLYKWGSPPINEVVSKFMITFLEDVTINK